MKNNEKETRLKKENKLNKNKYEYKLVYYVICYVICYVISLCVTGVPNLMYLIPIKVDAILIAMVIGTLWNTYHYKITGYDARRYGFLPGVIGIGLFTAITGIVTTLSNYGIISNSNPFFGFM